ncbi:MAG: hypothetical protein ACLTI1_06445 [Clostridia bacterium]
MTARPQRFPILHRHLGKMTAVASNRGASTTPAPGEGGSMMAMEAAPER